MANLDTQTRSTLAAYFQTHAAAQMAIEELRLSGFTSGQIGLAGRSAANSTNKTDITGTMNTPGTTTAAGTGTTSTVGNTASNLGHAAANKTEGAWGKIKNFFEGGDVEPYADERAKGNPVSSEITDPSLRTQGGYDTDGYDATDIHDSFANLSIPEEHSRYFGHRLGQGEEGAVVTVNAAGREQEAEAILTRNGGDLGANAASYDYSEGTATTAAAGAMGATGANRIQLLGEVLRVHKDRISSGEVRLRKEVITENQTIQVPVSHEELVLERVAGDGMTPVQGTVGADSEIRVPLSQEVASVDKQTVVREQVSVGKRSVEEVRDLDSSVAHEELRVEDEGRTATNPTNKY